MPKALREAQQQRHIVRLLLVSFLQQRQRTREKRREDSWLGQGSLNETDPKVAVLVLAVPPGFVKVSQRQTERRADAPACLARLRIARDTMVRHGRVSDVGFLHAFHVALKATVPVLPEPLHVRNL